MPAIIFTRKEMVNTMNDFSIFLEDFFLKYLSVERGCSINTRKNYRDTFAEILEYLNETHNIPSNHVQMETLDFNMVNGFLDWLENTKGLSVSTRNNRLAGLKSYFKYVSYRAPQYLNRCNSILAIKAKKTTSAPMNYLTIAAIELLFSSFNLENIHDLRDYSVIAMLYESGARVSELIAIKVFEVRLDQPATVVLHGKGGKSRIVPIDATVAKQISRYLTAYQKRSDDYLFTNSQSKPLTRKGVDYMLQKHFEKAKSENPSLFPTKISPHCIRHSRAMHLLENGVNLVYIRDLLGHSSVTTTEIYAKANPEIKRKYIQAASIGIIDHPDYDQEQMDDLLNWLKDNI